MIPKDVELTLICEPGDDGWWIARVPQVPGATSQGRTQAEAMEAALVALALVMQSRRGYDSEDRLAA